MQLRAAPLAALAATICLTAVGCKRSPLGEGRDAAVDLPAEAPTLGDSRPGPQEASVDVVLDAPVGDAALADAVASDAPADDGSPADAPADGTDAPMTADATDARPQDQSCGALGVDCAPFACDVVHGICKTFCVSDDDCSAGRLCRNGSCGGSPSTCTANNECNSGFCTQGICCNAACNQPCTSCVVAGTLGVCTAVASGSPDPLNRCPGGLMCDGAGACQPPTCTTDDQCAVLHWCQGGRCLPCLATCTSNAACAGDAICIRRNECSYCGPGADAGP